MSKANPPPGADAMASGASALPAEVLEALARHDPIQAIKHLRAATGLGLKEAKEVVEAHLQGRPPSSLPPSPGSASFSSVPPAVLAALHQGQKIEAIRLLREHSGLGLKEAKDVVDALPQTAGQPAQAGDLAPGEVRRSTGLLRIVVVLVLLGLAFAWWLRHP
jgi:ribosomal protein L7/L12